MTPKWGSNASAGRMALLPGALWAHDASKMAILGASRLLCLLQLRRACFRQARVAQAVLLPGTLFRVGAFALPPFASNLTCARSHIWGFPI